MGSLDTIGRRHNTDKAKIFLRDKRGKTRAGHNYLNSYEKFFAPFRHKEELRILELGAGPDWNCGASARTWKEYFTAAQTIRIVDIDPGAAFLADEGFDMVIGDLGDPSFLKSLCATPKWDIIIDDASHQWQHQVIGFNALFSRVAEGGLYVIEGLHTSFGDLRERFGKPYVAQKGAGPAIDAAEYFSQMALQKLGHGEFHPSGTPEITRDIEAHVDLDQIEMISFIAESCIISKV